MHKDQKFLYSIFLIVGASWLVYGQTLGFGYVALDDVSFITQNRNVLSGLTLESIFWAFTTDESGMWHPLTWLTFQFETTLLKKDSPIIRHTSNVVLHTINSVLVYFVARQISLRYFSALIVAIFFAVHPQHVQVVAWVSERKELLSTCFALMTFLSYCSWRKTNQRNYYYLVLALYLAALLSKPSAVPIMAVLIVADIVYYKNVTLKTCLERVIEYVPLAMLAIIVSMITIQIKTEGQLEMVLSDGHQAMGVSQWLLLIPINFAHYLKTSLLSWPLPLLIETPRFITTAMLISAVMIIVIASLVIFYNQKIGRAFCLSILWFILCWIPVSGIISMGTYYVADRYMYLPHIGLFIAFALILGQLQGRVNGQLLYALILTIVSGYAVLAYQQTGYWKDSVTLFTREIEINPNSDRAPIYVGWQKLQGGDYQNADKYYSLSIKNRPESYYGYAYKGFLKHYLGEHKEALELYERSLKTHNYRAGHNLDYLYNNLTLLYYEKGEYLNATRIIERTKKHYTLTQYQKSIEAKINNGNSIQSDK